jgi:FtsJ-like methyltransferase
MPPKKNANKKELENKKKKPETETDTETEPESVTDTVSESPSRRDEEKEEVEINVDNQPLCFEIPKIKENIFNSEPNIQISENINYPRFEYGFHHFIHQSKNYFNDETNKFEGKKKVWNVLNRYEPTIDNFSKSISDISKDYFKGTSKVEIVNYSFYKLWELLMYYDLVDLKKDSFVSGHILDNAGGFTQATMYYRDMFSNKSKNDKYNYISFKNNQIRKVEDNEIDKKLSDEKKVDVVKSEDDVKQNCDLITANGSFGNMNENLQEQEAPTMLVYEILAAMKNLKKNGNFVCRFLETFTDITIKIIAILSVLFDNVQFSKPLMSKLSSTERYAICTGFKFSENDKDLKKYISVLENIYEKMQKRKEGNNVVNIFMDFKIPRELIVSITNMNVIISNEHLKNINIIISFIRNQVYSGEEYHDKRNEQIEGAKYWTDLYLPKEDKIDSTRKKTEKIMEEALSITKERSKELNKTLVAVM